MSDMVHCHDYDPACRERAVGTRLRGACVNDDGEPRKSMTTDELLAYISNPDPVNRPHHYRWHPSGVECIDIASGFDYALGNVIKYVWRCDYKGKPIEDLLKAKTYLERAIADREAKSEGSASDA